MLNLNVPEGGKIGDYLKDRAKNEFGDEKFDLFSDGHKKDNKMALNQKTPTQLKK